jgi:large subunit ribosomal protein L21
MSENDQETPENSAAPEAAAATETETTTVAVAPTPAPSKPKGYAIIETGGKQYRVSVGDRISVERLPDDAGGEITIDRVLLIGGEGATRVGAPVVEGATVTATVDDHYRGEKIIVFKYKAKKRYRRRIGHRQELTHLKITAIAG